MKLITMIEVSDASEEDEHKIAKLLTVSYCEVVSKSNANNNRFHTSYHQYSLSLLLQV